MFSILAAIKGNGKQYSAKNENPVYDSPLKSMKILFLGSSVTYGSGARGESFVDFIAKKHGVIAIKEAVPGTTLAGDSNTSFIQRLKKVNATGKIDAFVCQLSTNDARKKLPIGEISRTENYDSNTVAGAMETVISHARETWNCPIIFLTGTKYKSAHYAKMVHLLLEVQKKWNIGVIDLWNDVALNDIPAELKKMYTLDGVHPTRAGYKLWWLPAIEKYLHNHLVNR